MDTALGPDTTEDVAQFLAICGNQSRFNAAKHGKGMPAGHALRILLQHTTGIEGVLRPYTIESVGNVLHGLARLHSAEVDTLQTQTNHVATCFSSIVGQAVTTDDTSLVDNDLRYLMSSPMLQPSSLSHDSGGHGVAAQVASADDIDSLLYSFGWRPPPNINQRNMPRGRVRENPNRVMTQDLDVETAARRTLPPRSVSVPDVSLFQLNEPVVMYPNVAPEPRTPPTTSDLEELEQNSFQLVVDPTQFSTATPAPDRINSADGGSVRGVQRLPISPSAIDEYGRNYNSDYNMSLGAFTRLDALPPLSQDDVGGETLNVEFTSTGNSEPVGHGSSDINNNNNDNDSDNGNEHREYDADDARLSLTGASNSIPETQFPTAHVHIVEPPYVVRDSYDDEAGDPQDRNDPLEGQLSSSPPVIISAPIASRQLEAVVTGSEEASQRSQSSMTPPGSHLSTDSPPTDGSPAYYLSESALSVDSVSSLANSAHRIPALSRAFDHGATSSRYPPAGGVEFYGISSDITPERRAEILREMDSLVDASGAGNQSGYLGHCNQNWDWNKLSQIQHARSHRNAQTADRSIDIQEQSNVWRQTDNDDIALRHEPIVDSPAHEHQQPSAHDPVAERINDSGQDHSPEREMVSDISDPGSCGVANSGHEGSPVHNDSNHGPTHAGIQNVSRLQLVNTDVDMSRVSVVNEEASHPGETGPHAEGEDPENVSYLAANLTHDFTLTTFNGTSEGIPAAIPVAEPLNNVVNEIGGEDIEVAEEIIPLESRGEYAEAHTSESAQSISPRSADSSYSFVDSDELRGMPYPSSITPDNSDPPVVRHNEPGHGHLAASEGSVQYLDPLELGGLDPGFNDVSSVHSPAHDGGPAMSDGGSAMSYGDSAISDGHPAMSDSHFAMSDGEDRGEGPTVQWQQLPVPPAQTEAHFTLLENELRHSVNPSPFWTLGAEIMASYVQRKLEHAGPNTKVSFTELCCNVPWRTNSTEDFNIDSDLLLVLLEAAARSELTLEQDTSVLNSEIKVAIRAM